MPHRPACPAQKVVFGLAALLAPGCASAPRPPAEAPAVVIISIDGLLPDFYLDSSYPAPTLRRLASLGASAEGAETIYPSITYPSHTTIVSGVRSATHGIHSNTVFSLKEGDTPKWYWETSYLKAPTIWGELQARGRRAAILTWPVSVGAKADWLVPELFPPSSASKESTWELTRRSMDPALLKELAEHNREKELDGFDKRDRWVTDAAHHLLSRHRPDLTLIHIINLDHAEHASGRDSRQAREALGTVDSQLARIIEPLDLASTTLFVLGDHGFYDFDKVIHPNTLFAKRGWLKVSKDGGIAPDWKVLTQVSGGTAAVYSRDPRLKPAIVSLLRKNAGSAYRVIERDELDRLGAFPGAVCAVDPLTSVPDPAGGKALPGYGIGKEAVGPLITRTGAVRGNHGPMPSDPLMRTGFIAVGPGIPAGKRLGLVRLLDVAPTAARILGVPLPTAEGKPIDLSGGDGG